MGRVFILRIPELLLISVLRVKMRGDINEELMNSHLIAHPLSPSLETRYGSDTSGGVHVN